MVAGESVEEGRDPEARGSGESSPQKVEEKKEKAGPEQPAADEPKQLVFVRFLSSNRRPEVCSAVASILNEIEGLFLSRRVVFRVHSDRASELVGKDMKDLVQSYGARLTMTSGEEPMSDGIAERMIQTLKSRARRMMMTSSHLSQEFWPFAIQYVAEASKQNVTRKIVIEAPYGNKVYSRIKSRPKGDQWQARAHPGYYLGPCAEASGSAYVLREDGYVETTGSWQESASQPERPEVEECSIADPFGPAKGVEGKGWSCPACRGRHQPHTRVEGECRKGKKKPSEESPKRRIRGKTKAQALRSHHRRLSSSDCDQRDHPAINPPATRTTGPDGKGKKEDGRIGRR